jgi:hypothetical protein
MQPSTSRPHGWKAGLKRALWPHSAFALVGVGIRVAAPFLPPPFGPAALAGFALWRVGAEIADYRGKRDTGPKAIIDVASQVGWAAATAFIPFS